MTNILHPPVQGAAFDEFLASSRTEEPRAIERWTPEPTARCRPST